MPRADTLRSPMLPCPSIAPMIPEQTSSPIRNSSRPTLKMSSENIPISGSITSRSGLTRALLSLLLGAAAAHGADLSPTETTELIEKMKEHRAKFPSLTADFTEEKTSRLLQKPLITSGTIAFTTPNLFRREVKGVNPSTTVCDGHELWIYYPNFNEAEHYVLGQHS